MIAARRTAGLAAATVVIIFLAWLQLLNVAVVDNVGGAAAANALAARMQLPGAKIEARFLAATALARAQAAPRDWRALDRAADAISVLPLDREGLAARARLALLKGERDQAFALAVQAGAVDTVTVVLDDLDGEGNVRKEDALNDRWLRLTVLHAVDREAAAAAFWRRARLANVAADRTRDAARSRRARERALTALRQELLLTPLSGQALLTAGYAAWALGHRAEARRDFAAAIAADPASASGYVGLARVDLAARRQSDALREAQFARLYGPGQADVKALLRDSF